MSLNNTYFESKGRVLAPPIPDTPGYTPPVVPTPQEPIPGSVPNIPRPTFSGTTSITLYVNNSETCKANKSLTSKLTDTIDIKDRCDIQRPEIYINTSTDITDCNYMQMLDRYYFVTVELIKGNLYKISGRTDVLSTFWPSLSGHSAIIKRSSSQYNTFLQDEQMPLQSYETYKTFQFPSGFSKSMNYLLLTVGGASNP